jgi:hypothetical protein
MSLMDGQQNGSPQSDEPTWHFEPGQTISPRNHDAPSAPLAQAPPQTQAEPIYAAPQPQSQPNPQPQQPQPVSVSAPEPAHQPVTQPAPVRDYAAQPEVTVSPAPAATAQPAPMPAFPTEPLPLGDNDEPDEQPMPERSVSWTASEFIAHSKTAGWHLLLVIGAAIIAAVVWFLTKDFISSLVIVVGGVAISFYGAHKPQQMQYQLSNHGLIIGRRQFVFSDFKAFSVIPEGAFSSIALIPTKRFAPLTTLYYDPQDEDSILDILGSFLPLQDRRTDAIDSLMRRIRF